ncbi:CaaX-protease [Pochonia chlamydosporia 170]|uniref:intramembrane prenyl-peptidase Rce1 n=1 Tax=Pochonia chlamydosporia 170 TaxID=1380566 RepID=A0A179F9Y2_METCM|nr:CaaX-protease [Pochonia chlamydosporia 170]OAQ62274.1 CaaX-protease [Pochonia chlamydosporia 170]
MGYWPIGVSDATKSLLLTGLLFAGPLYECLIIDGVWESWLRLEPLARLQRDWAMWRNMVAGPITEECLFRSAAVPLLLVAGCSMRGIIFLSPLVFGLAHLHHFYEFRVTHPETPLVAAIARSIIQLSYTSVFGAYATFLFLRTGSLISVIAVHALCNSMGLPRFWGVLEPYWLPAPEVSHPSNILKWTIPYYVLLLGGSTLWWHSIWSLTASPLALAVV